MTNEEYIREKIGILKKNLEAVKALDEGKPIEVLTQIGWTACHRVDQPGFHEYRPKPGRYEVWLAVYSLDGMEWARGKYPSKQACEFRCAHVSNFARAVRFVGVRE